jgi:NTP pyrophosphatase (non-canonical NTP hydrolase)
MKVAMPDAPGAPPVLTLHDFQVLIDRMYSRKDEARGVEGTFMWLIEEVGELAAALRDPGRHSKDDLAMEFADVLAWLVTIANVAGVDLQAAVLKKYGKGCPGCGQLVCACDDAEKP